MNHPPIPPNCPYFKLTTVHVLKEGVPPHDVQEWYFHEAPSMSANFCEDISLRFLSSTTLGQHRKEQRHVVACVARCAWLDSRNYPPKEYEHERDSMGHEVWEAMCEENAEAWKDWGESK